MQNICPNCGANIKFLPTIQKCYCEYCGSKIDIGEFGFCENEINKKIEDKLNYDKYTCSACGANLIMDENTTITECVYCGGIQIVKERFIGELRPEALIPFKIDKNKFISIYKKFIKKKLLAPNEFRQNSKISNIKGLYVPFYIYTYDTNTYARGEAYHSGKKSYYKYFEFELNEKIRLPQDASLNLNDDITTSLEPFNYDELKEFNPAYLNGFWAEKGSEDLEEINEKAKRRAQNECEDNVKRAIYRDRYCGGKMNIKLKQLERKYVLLPIWLFNTEYKGKKYSYALNGQTGKFAGQVPMSLFKFWTMLIIMIAGIILSIVCLENTNFLLYWLVGSVAICIIASKRYATLKPVFENKVEVLKKGNKNFKLYPKFIYNQKFGKDDYEKLDTQIILE